MSVVPRYPDNPGECQRLIDELRRRNDELQRHAEDAQRRIAELQRVLEETAADYSQLQEKHTELAETLALLRRYVFGPRRESFHDDPGQGHLFDLHDTAGAPEADAQPEPDTAAAVPTSKAARSKRRTSLDHLPHNRIEHDLPEQEKICSCCGDAKQRIGEDLSRELDFIPAKLIVNVHVLPKYACPKCRDGVASPPVPPSRYPEGSPGPA